MKEFGCNDQFSEIRKIAKKNNLNIIEAIASYCEDHDIQIEDLIHNLDKNIREEIRVAAIEHRYIRGVKKPVTLF